jgi:hypothetical protein
MNTPTFDLVEIIKVIQRNVKMILGITLAATIIGAVAFKLKDKKYKAKSEVYMLNPLFGDRLNILRRSVGDSRLVNYFGTEGDVDRAMTMVESKDVEDSVIAACDLYKTYQLDPSKAKDRAAMSAMYRDNFEAKRTENATIICTYEDNDAERSAHVLNAIMKISDFNFRKYLSNIKTNAVIEINRKVEVLNEQIDLYTDSVIALREKYKIYDLLSPSRQNMMSGSISPVGKINPAEGIEVLQNMESIKDQLVMNRSEQIATAYELQTSNFNEVNILHYVSSPTPPNKASGLGFILTTLACGLAAFFFSVLLFSFTSYIKALANTER